MTPITASQKHTLENKANNLYYFKGETGVDNQLLDRLVDWVKSVSDKQLASNILSAWYACQMPETPNQQLSLNNLAAFISIAKAYKEASYETNAQMPNNGV